LGTTKQVTRRDALQCHSQQDDEIISEKTIIKTAKKAKIAGSSRQHQYAQKYGQFTISMTRDEKSRKI